MNKIIVSLLILSMVSLNLEARKNVESNSLQERAVVDVSQLIARSRGLGLVMIFDTRLPVNHTMFTGFQGLPIYRTSSERIREYRQVRVEAEVNRQNR